MRKMQGRRIAVVLLAIVMLLGVGAGSSPANASGSVGCTQEWWPTTGAVATHSDSQAETATFGFRLTEDQWSHLQCVAPYVEIDFHLEGKWVPPQWDDYIVIANNLPGAIHDVAASDFTTSTPGVTMVRVSDLQFNFDYSVTIAWSPLANQSATPGVWVGWIPSYWATSAPEVAACNWGRVFGRFGDAWCVFPYVGVQDATFYYRQGTLGVNQVPFGGNHVYGFGAWANNIPSDIQMLPTLSSANLALLQQLVPVPTTSRQMFLRGDSTVFAKDDLANGNWAQETDPASINKIAVGGTTQMVLNACNAVYAKNILGNGGWTQETPCNGAAQIAVSSTGVQMLIDACSAVWAKTGIGYGGWTQEVGCGNATAIAVGGNTQMFIRGDAAIFAKNTIGDGGWVQEVGPGNAGAIAVDSTGLQAFIRGDAAVFAKRGIGDGGWQMQVGPGNAGAIAAGGGVLLFLRGDSAVFAKTNIGIDGGWTQETEPGTANLIDVGDNGRQMIRTGDNAVWAKDGIGYGGWLPQVGAGNANAIAVG